MKIKITCTDAEAKMLEAVKKMLLKLPHARVHTSTAPGIKICYIRLAQKRGL